MRQQSRYNYEYTLNIRFMCCKYRIIFTFKKLESMDFDFEMVINWKLTCCTQVHVMLVRSYRVQFVSSSILGHIRDISSTRIRIRQPEIIHFIHSFSYESCKDIAVKLSIKVLVISVRKYQIRPSKVLVFTLDMVGAQSIVKGDIMLLLTSCSCKRS